MRKSFITLAILALTLSGCGSINSSNTNHSSTAMGSAAKMGGTYIDTPLSQAAAMAELFDSTGKKFNLDSLKGKYLVIANFLTSCQEICPMTSANIRDIGEAIKKAGLSSEAQAMVISVDSGRDNASRIAAYKEMYGSNNWIVASGSEDSLRIIWKYFGAPATKEAFTPDDLKKMPVDWQTGKPATYDMVHADLVVIVDPKGHWRWLDLGAPKVSTSIPGKLKAFLSPQGISNLTKPEEPAWSIAAVTSALSDLLGKKI